MTETLFERYKEALRAGHVAVLRGRLEDAAAAYREAISITADRAVPRTALGGVQLRLGDPAGALEAFDGALALEPDDDASLLGRAQALVVLRRTAEAAVVVRPASPTSGPARGRARRRRRGRPPGARHRADRRAARSGTRASWRSSRAAGAPRSSDAGRRRGRAAGELADASTAGDADAATPPEPPPDPEALIVAFEEAAARGDAESAAAAALAAARAHRAEGRVAAAFDACLLGIGVRPGDVDLHLLLADLAVDRGWIGPGGGRLPPAAPPRGPRRRRRRGRPRAAHRGRPAARATLASPPADPRAGACGGASGRPEGRCYTHRTMSEFLESIAGQVGLATLVDIGLTAVVIYWVFSLIRGTRAVRLVIGVSVILVIYGVAQAAGLRLFTQLLQAGAVVGLFALVVVFQPELRRGLERLGRVGSFAWLLSPVRPAGGRAGRRRRRPGGDPPGGGAHRRPHRDRAGDGPRGDRRDRRHDPRRPDGRPPRGALRARAARSTTGRSSCAARRSSRPAPSCRSPRRRSRRSATARATGPPSGSRSRPTRSSSSSRRRPARRASWSGPGSAGTSTRPSSTGRSTALLRPERRGDALRDRLGRPGATAVGLRRAALGDLGRAARESGADEPRDDAPGAAAGAGG